jgi:hypothetical protein
VAVGLVLLSFTACSSNKPRAATPGATVPTAPPFTTTTTDPYAVPPVIDATYVNRVLAGLDQAVGDVVRIVVSQRTLPPEAIERLRSVYADEVLLQLQIDSFQRDLSRNLRDYKASPGNASSKVLELITTKQSCIYAKINRDVSQIAVAADPRLSTQWIAVKPHGTAARAFNPTGWSYIYEGFQRDLTAPSTNPCASVS